MEAAHGRRTKIQGRALWQLSVLAMAFIGCAQNEEKARKSAGADSSANGAVGQPPGQANPGSVPATSSPGPAFGAGGSSGAAPAPGGYQPAPMGNTNVALGGAQDFGYFRRLVNEGKVPRAEDFDAAGFFGEHHTALPAPLCGERICLQPMLAVMGNLMDGNGCTMLQLGLNSPLVADPNKRPPLTLAVVIDVSGSMNEGGKIDFVKQGLEKLIDSLRDGDKVAIITYSDRVTVNFPMQDASLKRVELRDLARGLTASGSTNIHDGLRRGYEEVRMHYDLNRQNRVIFLSDGNATVGITGTPEILKMSKSWNSEGYGLTTIGLGSDFNPQLMRQLAQQADGNFYFLENSGAVKEVFTEEINYFTVPVAFDVKVELQNGSHYNFGRAYGSSFWKNTPGGGGLEVPSVFLAHRKSDTDQTKEGGRRGGGSALLVELMPKRTTDDGSGLASADVAIINVQFREPGTNRIVRDKVIVNYPNAPWKTVDTGYFQSAGGLSIVQKSFVMLNVYQGIENAVKDFAKRDTRNTIANLRRLMAAVEDYNDEIGDLDIKADQVLLSQFLMVLKRNGVMDPTEPVRIPANPWPAD